jgi:hypothetical protein
MYAICIHGSCSAGIASLIYAGIPFLCLAMFTSVDYYKLKNNGVLKYKKVRNYQTSRILQEVSLHRTPDCHLQPALLVARLLLNRQHRMTLFSPYGIEQKRARKGPLEVAGVTRAASQAFERTHLHVSK